MSRIRRSRVRSGLAKFGGGLSANFWRLWGSAAAANLADGIIFVAIQLIAVRLGASPAALAGIGIAQRGPMLALGLIAGGLADRTDRRRTMVAAQILRCAATGTLLALALTDSLSLLALAVAAVALGVGEAFFDTNAQSVVPMLVGRERLVAANGRLYAIETLMGTLVGPPMGAVLVAMSIPLALSGAAVGFALAAVGLTLLTGTFRAESAATPAGLRSEIAEGIRFLIQDRVLLALTSMAALQHAGSAAVFFFLALYAVRPGPMGLSEPGYGLLLMTFGVGSLVGSFTTGAVVARFGRAGVLRLATLVLGLGLLVPALTSSAIAVGAGCFAVSFALMTFGITNVSVRQAVVPSGLMGRTNATYRTIAYAAGLVGAALAGAVGELVGLREAFALGALIVFLGLIGGFVVTDQRIAQAEAVGGRRPAIADG